MIHSTVDVGFPDIKLGQGPVAVSGRVVVDSKCSKLNLLSHLLDVGVPVDVCAWVVFVGGVEIDLAARVEKHFI